MQHSGAPKATCRGLATISANGALAIAGRRRRSDFSPPLAASSSGIYLRQPRCDVADVVSLLS